MPMVAICQVDFDNHGMSNAAEAPWGETYFEREQYLVPRVRREDYGGWGETPRLEFKEHADRAMEDPEYDAFAEMMPTGRPKRDIGRYVMRHSVPVPLVRSLTEWQHEMMLGRGMLRSELPQDYAGFSGLLRTMRIPIEMTYPRDKNGWPGYEMDRTPGEWATYRQTVEGPMHASIVLQGDIFDNRVGNDSATKTLHDMFATGLRDGTIDPSELMRLMFWREEVSEHYAKAAYKRYAPASIEGARASHWRYVPGANIRIMRDPVIEGKYFIGGSEAHHHWEITEGADSAPLSAHDKATYRGRGHPGAEPEYVIPTKKLVRLYERIRTLPYFDHRQTPVMEMQYGTDGKLYFLQYLKTGLTLGDPGAFELPAGPGTVTIDSVRGATTPVGETVRIYIDPLRLTFGMRDQAVFMDHFLGGRFDGNATQVAAMGTRITILNHALNFKNNHFVSAPLTRAAVAIGLWDGRGEAIKRFGALASPAETLRQTDKNRVSYIDAHVTANGRQATIASDWILKHEVMN